MPAADFDHHSAEYATDPLGCIDDLRDQGRVLFSEEHGGYWIPTTYEDVAAIARDDERFSSWHDPQTLTGDGCGPYTGIVLPGSPVLSSFIEMDPPEFLDYRRLLSKDFAPSAINALEPLMEAMTLEALQPHLETGEIDLVNDFATAVPTKVVLAWLGLPLDNWEVYAAAQHGIAHTPPNSPEYPAVIEAHVRCAEMLAAEINRRREVPTEDLLGRLIRSEIHGRALTDDELLGMLNLIISGAVDTTTSVMACALLYLDGNHGVRAELAAAAALLPPAIEEFLRYYTPNQAMARTVTRDTELGGAQLSAGDRVLVFWAAANSDPAEFPGADEVRLDRMPNRHTSFGLGMHKCLGAGLARTEMRIMLAEILRLMPNYAVDRERTVRYATLGINNGYVTMPARI